MKIVGIWWQKEENEKIINNSGDPSGDYDGISDRFSIYIMKIKIFNSDVSYVDLENKIDKWIDQLKPTIISVDLNVLNVKEYYEDGRICNQWIEYTAAIVYTT